MKRIPEGDPKIFGDDIIAYCRRAYSTDWLRVWYILGFHSTIDMEGFVSVHGYHRASTSLPILLLIIVRLCMEIAGAGSGASVWLPFRSEREAPRRIPMMN